MPPSRGPHLQTEIIAVLERIEPASVREVLQQLSEPRAFTTVATVLGRLVDQGRVTRSNRGGQWLYRIAPAHNRQLAQDIAELLHRAAGNPEPLLSALVGGVEDIDPALLDRLEDLIAARRREKNT